MVNVKHEDEIDVVADEVRYKSCSSTLQLLVSMRYM